MSHRTCKDSEAALLKAGSDVPNATVIAKMCAVESDGSDGELTLTKGQFQMNVEVAYWAWCGCEQDQGHFLEFILNIIVPAGYKISKNNNTVAPVKISLGTNDSFIMISTKVSKQNLIRLGYTCHALIYIGA